MAEITAALVKELRERTGAGMMECKAALVEARGDVPEAEVVLRKRGIASAGKKAERVTKQGLIGSYIHHGGQLGVLVEVNCESDFVARTDDFQELVHDISMHIAAADPRYVRKEDVPADVLELLQRGMTNAQIAHALSVGTETVRTHARNIYRKLGVSTRRDLARMTSPGTPVGV